MTLFVNFKAVRNRKNAHLLFIDVNSVDDAPVADARAVIPSEIASQTFDVAVSQPILLKLKNSGQVFERVAAASEEMRLPLLARGSL